MKPVRSGAIVAVICCTAGLIASAAMGADGSQGASAIREVHGDWIVNCRAPANQPHLQCSVSQQQFAKANGARVLAIALDAQSGGGAAGTIALPFGLSLEKGVTLQIDDAAVSPPWHFHTCLPSGCLVAVSWSKAGVEALRAAKLLKLSAVTDGGKPANFVVSLDGFAAALDRLTVLERGS